MTFTSSPVDTPDESAPPKLSLGLLVVAVASSLIASTCCVLPLVLVLVGITGAWMVHLTVLKPWVPLFTVIALLALLGSGYLLFRPLASCGVNDDACVDSRRVAQRIYLISGMFVSGLLLFPLVAPIFY
jgi:mercuric ion transport protein